MRVFWKSLFLCAGLALFAWYISRIGLDAVWRAIVSLGPWAPLVLVPYFIVYNVDCLAWVQTLPQAARKIGFLTLLRIRWCGESLNNLVPSAYVGGEALKVAQLRAHGISAADGATSAVVSKSAQTLAQLIFIVLASAVFLLVLEADRSLRSGLLFVCVAGAVAVVLMFWVQRRGMFRMLISLFEKLRIRFRPLETRKARFLEMDGTIASFYTQQPRRFYRSTALYLAGWILDTAEIYLVAHLLQMPISWPQALVVEAFTGVAKALGMWIPGSIGVQESGIILAGRLAGLPDTLCVAYAVIRRARELIFAAAGMLLLYMTPATLKPKVTALAQ